MSQVEDHILEMTKELTNVYKSASELGYREGATAALKIFTEERDGFGNGCEDHFQKVFNKLIALAERK